ncbi:MAG: flavin reductase family protein [Candidatus Thorarchaeota archaeon]
MNKVLLENPSIDISSPIVLITTVNPQNGKPNIMTLCWIGGVTAQPPQISISINTRNFSHNLVKESKEFAVNIPSADQIEQVTICGTKSGRDIDKWKECGFTPAKGIKIAVPLIEECPVNLECRVKMFIPAEEIGTNSLFIAEVLATHRREDITSGINIIPPCYSAGRFGKIVSLA